MILFMSKKSNLNISNYKKALDFSYSFYQSKYRKGIKYPYFTYLSSVSNLIIENNGSTDEAIAGLFHDILEDDNGVRRKNSIKLKFGVKVLNIVKQCSNIQNVKIEKCSQNDIKRLKKTSERSKPRFQTIMRLLASALRVLGRKPG